MPLTAHLNHDEPLSPTAAPSATSIAASDLLRRDWRRLVPLARNAIRSDGFLWLEPSDKLRDAAHTLFSRMRDFYGLGAEFRQDWLDTGSGFGWSPPGAEPAYQAGTRSRLESFDVVLESTLPARANEWPDIAGFREAVTATWEFHVELSMCLLDLLARCLGIEPRFFVSRCSSRELDTLRLLHYPPSPKPAASGEVGIAAHTDFECITLLYQDAPGLELRRPDGTWLEAGRSSGHIVVLFGDMLEVWSNGRIPATGHRVRRTTHSRLSVAHFIAADPGVRIEPIRHLVPAGEAPRYPSTEQALHIEQEIARARALKSVRQ